MLTFMMFVIAGLIVYLLIRMLSNSQMTATEEYFSQAGVTVNYLTRKISIKGRTYDVDDVQGIEHTQISRLSTEVMIKVDDFKKPIHLVGIIGVGKAGEKFIQRLEAALRKAGGPSFY